MITDYKRIDMKLTFGDTYDFYIWIEERFPVPSNRSGVVNLDSLQWIFW